MPDERRPPARQASAPLPDKRHRCSGYRRYTASAVSRRLELEELGVATAGAKQLLVRAQFRDAPVGDDRDPIGDADGGEAVGDDDADPAAEVFLQLGEDRRFGLRIER